MRRILVQCLAATVLLRALPAAVAAAQTTDPFESTGPAQAEVSPMPSAEVSPGPGDDPATDGSGGIRIPLPAGLLLFAIILSAGLVVGKFQAARR